jgi:predicted PurR-regulated permease PerM
MDKLLKLPFYAKATLYILCLIGLLLILYMAQGIIIPFVFATIVAIVLHPVVNFLVRIGINRLVAIILTLLLTIIVIIALGGLLITQVSRFTESWPILVDKFTATINQTISGASTYFNIDQQKIDDWITKTKDEILTKSSAVIGQTLINLGSMLVVLLLVPVYIFMLLFYQPLLLDFIHKLFGTNNSSKVSEIVKQTKTVIQRYLIGLIIEAVIVGTLYSVALQILGIDYAILLGIIGALINVIPYIGGIVGVALPMMVALVTKSTAWYAFYIMIIFYIIQLIDNNYIVPKIVASKVKINALFSIIAVIVGNALWGIPGMFLSIPLLAIIKLIFDHIDPLKPWGFLLGDTMPPILKIKPIRFWRILKKTK